MSSNGKTFDPTRKWEFDSLYVFSNSYPDFNRPKFIHYFQYLKQRFHSRPNINLTANLQEMHWGSFLFPQLEEYKEQMFWKLLTNTNVCSILINSKTQKTHPQTVLQHHRTGLIHTKTQNCAWINYTLSSFYF